MNRVVTGLSSEARERGCRSVYASFAPPPFVPSELARRNTNYSDLLSQFFQSAHLIDIPSLVSSLYP